MAAGGVNRVRPDLARRTGSNNVFLMSEDQDFSPATSMFAAMNPPAAAALLTGKSAVDAEGAITAADVDLLKNAVGGDATVVAMSADRRRPPNMAGPAR
ncbi:hypothetical protein ACIA5G_39265 [Amycolatopsis sp. NPDC051758]|uniref:hypothetical protein n=1 Tax=Amycolatopsis sp. NPDC051758 TaxID=3363935 RepID=UPI00378C8491